MVEMTLSQLIDSSLLTSIQKIHIHPKTLLNHILILHPLILHPPPLAVLVLDDMFISLHIYLTTCNTLGGSDVVNINNISCSFILTNLHLPY